ncbi:MAG: PH domain-containing protein [Clostridia bacterium]|nr:PH domain-containing protein [Clostridia bacterium]
MTQKGFFSIKRENLELSRIVDISSSESFVERLFGLGTITLRTIDKTDPVIVMRGLENYKELEAKLKEYASKKRPTVIEAFKGTSSQNIDTVAIDD